MALKVWLPLNGDLHNQGTSDITAINIPSGATIDNTGKIGKCYTSNGSANGVATSFNFEASQFSITAWVRINTRVNEWRCPFKLVNSSAADKYQYIGFCCEHNTQATYVGFHFYKTIDGTNTAIFDSYSITDMAVGEWTHLAVTYDGKVATYYKNGIKVSSTTIAAAKQNTVADIDRIIMLGGNGNRGGAAVKSSLNDVRVYDECLSAATIHEIAQGLVLHYKLDGGLFGNPNLVLGSGTAAISTNKWAGHSATGGNTSTIEYDNNTPCVRVARDSVTQSSWDYLSYDRLLQSQIKTNTTYTITFDCKPDVDGSIGFTGFVNGNATNYLTASTTNVQNNCYANKWNHMIYRCVTKSSFDDITIGSQVVYFSRSTSLRAVNVSILFKNIKVEEGDAETPWCPADSELTIDRTIIEDSSGYNHNGLLNDPNVIFAIDTARYNICMLNSQSIDSAIYPIRGECNIPESTALTFTWWMKPTQFGKQISGIFSTSNEQLPTDYQTTAANMRDSGFDCCNNTGTCVRINVANYITLNEWHHYALVYNGNALLFYKDGELKTSINQTGALKAFKYIFLFYSKAGGVNRTTSGYLSDFRIYCTPLLDTDIKQLYNVSMKVDNLGGVHGHEFMEEINNIKENEIVVFTVDKTINYNKDDDIYTLSLSPHFSGNHYLWYPTKNRTVANHSVEIPWGCSFVHTFEIFSDKTINLSIDYNDGSIDSNVTLSGNDNDTNRLPASVSLTENTWKTVTFSYSNTNESKNPNHVTLYDYSYVYVAAHDDSYTIKVKSPMTYVVDNNSKMSISKNGIISYNQFLESSTKNYGSISKKTRAVEATEFIEM